jgi:hypothetical protein
MKQPDLLRLRFSVFIFNNLLIAKIASYAGMFRQSGNSQIPGKQGTAFIPGRINSMKMYIGFIS